MQSINYLSLEKWGTLKNTEENAWKNLLLTIQTVTSFSKISLWPGKMKGWFNLGDLRQSLSYKNQLFQLLSF